MLQIETKPALLGINYNLPQVNLEFQRPQGSSQISNPKVNIRAEAAILEIDQTRCFEEIGLYKTGALAKSAL